MKKSIQYSLILIAIILTNNVMAQLSLPYYSGFDTPSQQAGWQLYKLGVDATYGPWGVSAMGYSAPNCIYHDYNNSGTVEDWYVSPALNITTSSVISLKINPFAITGSPTATDYIGIWFSSGAQNPGSGQYTEIADLTGLTSSANLWLDTLVSLPATVGTVYIGLKYKNVNNWFTISIDNINVTTSTGINEVAGESGVIIYPNPSKADLFIDTKTGINSIEIFNLTGQKVYSNDAFGEQSSNKINLSDYPKGIYFVKIMEGTNICLRRIVIQ